MPLSTLILTWKVFTPNCSCRKISPHYKIHSNLFFEVVYSMFQIAVEWSVMIPTLFCLAHLPIWMLQFYRLKCLFHCFSLKNEMRPTHLLFWLIPLWSAHLYVMLWLRFQTCHTYVFQQHEDNDRVSVKKLSNCQVSEMPLLKAGDKKAVIFKYILSLCFIASGTWQKSLSWSTRRSWCIAG